MNLNNKPGLSLTELIVAIVLLSVMFAAAISFNMAGFNFYSDADRFAQTQLAISPSMELIATSISRGIGTVSSPAVTIDHAGPDDGEISIRVDSNGNGQSDSSDNVIRFYKDVNNIIYSPNCPGSRPCATTEKIAKMVTALTFSANTDTSINVTITARYDPSKIANDNNPEVELETTVFQRSASLN